MSIKLSVREKIARTLTPKQRKFGKPYFVKLPGGFVLGYEYRKAKNNYNVSTGEYEIDIVGYIVGTVNGKTQKFRYDGKLSKGQNMGNYRIKGNELYMSLEDAIKNAGITGVDSKPYVDMMAENVPQASDVIETKKQELERLKLENEHRKQIQEKDKLDKTDEEKEQEKLDAQQRIQIRSQQQLNKNDIVEVALKDMKNSGNKDVVNLMREIIRDYPEITSYDGNKGIINKVSDNIMEVIFPNKTFKDIPKSFLNKKKKEGAGADYERMLRHYKKLISENKIDHISDNIFKSMINYQLSQGVTLDKMTPVEQKKAKELNIKS